MTRPTLSPGRWRQVDELFQATLRRPRDRRRAFLDEACAGDAELRREVESLIAADEDTDGFMLRPVRDEATAIVEERAVSLTRQIADLELQVAEDERD